MKAEDLFGTKIWINNNEEGTKLLNLLDKLGFIGMLRSFFIENTAIFIYNLNCISYQRKDGFKYMKEHRNREINIKTLIGGETKTLIDTKELIVMVVENRITIGSGENIVELDLKTFKNLVKKGVGTFKDSDDRVDLTKQEIKLIMDKI